jgi:hypothetical protein
MATEVLDAAGATLSVDVPGFAGTALVSVRGSYVDLSGVFEITPNGVDWHAVNGFSNDTQAWQPGPCALTQQHASWYVPCGGAQAVRLRVTALLVGTVTADLTPAVAVPLPAAGQHSEQMAPTQVIKTVLDPATPERLAPRPGACFRSATLIGLRGPQTPNLGMVFLGVSSGDGDQPIAIAPGQVWMLTAPAGGQIDLYSLWLDVRNAGDGVAVLYPLAAQEPAQGAGAATAATVLLASAAQSATVATADQLNPDAIGVVLSLDITATPNNAETLTLVIEAKDPASGKYGALTAFAALVASALGATPTTATYFYTLAPGVAETAAVPQHEAQALALPHIWRARVVHSGAGQWGYSLAGSLVP